MIKIKDERSHHLSCVVLSDGAKRRVEGPAVAFAVACFVALTLCTLLPAASIAQQPPAQSLTIKIINARTNKPITDEKLNVALRVDQIGSVQMPTDKNGIIAVDAGDATTIRILSNMYADCRPRGELYTNYSITDVINAGITTGNLCSNAKPKAKPGELILYEIPKTFIRKYPEPPVTTMPHSDENPHQSPY